MNHYTDIKTVAPVLPQAVGTTQVNGVIDTRGFRYAIIDVIMGAALEANPLTVLKLQEAPELDNGALKAAVTANVKVGGAEAGEGVDFLFPAVTGGVAQSIVRFAVKVGGRRHRYLGISLKSTAARQMCVVAHLCRSEKDLPTDAAKGCDLVVGA